MAARRLGSIDDTFYGGGINGGVKPVDLVVYSSVEYRGSSLRCAGVCIGAEPSGSANESDGSGDPIFYS